MTKAHQGNRRILSQRHRRGTRVILPAAEGHGEIARPHDGRDNADMLAAGLKVWALFDVGFEIAAIMAGLRRVWHAIEASGLQGIG